MSRLWLAIKVIEVRLRFVAILVVTGLVIGYWESIRNRWERWTRRATPTPAITAATEYFCPMHPHIVRTEPDPGGVTPKCPICGMVLSVRPRGAQASLPTGVTARVQLSPDRIQLAGVRTIAVEYLPLVHQVTTLGNVLLDEGRVTVVTSRTSGYLEKLLVSRTFESVTAGQPLVEIYSPDLETAAQELVLATRANAVGELGSAARRKLELLGMAREDVDAIVKSGHFDRRLVLRAPMSGHIVSKPAQPGAHVEAGATLFEIADLSELWIEADVYEKDIPFVVPGLAVEATVEALPTMVFPGRISLVHPHVDGATRTNSVRIVVPNPGHLLRPGMAASVMIKVPLAELAPWRDSAKTAAAKATWTCPMHPEIVSDQPGQSCPKCGMKLEPRKVATGAGVLAIPESAVIDTGTRRVVYVESTPGVYDGREVLLGPRSGDHYPVIKGLAAGERVVDRAAFLIDAETRLNPAAAGTFSGGGSAGSRQ